MRGDDLWTLADFFQKARDLDISLADIPTAYWQQWAKNPDFQQAPRLPKLRYAISGPWDAPEVERLVGDIE